MFEHHHFAPFVFVPPAFSIVAFRGRPPIFPHALNFSGEWFAARDLPPAAPVSLKNCKTALGIFGFDFGLDFSIFVYYCKPMAYVFKNG
jgi:hypothetical protein